MTVAASRRPGLVAPDIPAHVREARAFAQLGDVPRRLARLVGTRDPLELVGTDHVVGHRASLKTVATSPARAPGRRATLSAEMFPERGCAGRGSGRAREAVTMRGQPSCICALTMR